MSRDMVHTCVGTSCFFLGWLGTLFGGSGLVVPGGVEGEFAEEFAVSGEDADVQVVDQDGDLGAGHSPAQPDVVQPAVVPDGDGAAVVDGVGADPVVGLNLWPGRDGLGAGRVGLGGCAPLQRPVGRMVL
jgi:hypothetical protein